MDDLVWIHLTIGPLLLLIALLFRKFPPRNINSIYGYRTSRSMKSQAAWAFANKRSANGLLVVSLAVMLGQISLYFLLDLVTVLLIAAGILLSGLIGIVLLTEFQLRSKGY